jgi:phosphoesterase RecJ-like protein
MTTDYDSNTTLAEIARRVREAKRVALVSHQKPDGDAIGSLLALARALPGIGVDADAFVMGPLEPPLLALAGDTPLHRVEESPPGDDYDLILVVDTGAWSQLEPLEAWLRRHHDRVVGVDHHPQGDDVAALRVVDPAAPAAAEMVLTLLDELGCALPAERGGGPAEALFVGLATDTGWFRFSNAGVRAFAAAARLIALGVDNAGLHGRLEAMHRPARLQLAARALASVEYVADGTVAVQMLGPEDFAETGGSVSDLTDLVNLPMAVGSVRAAILLTEAEPGQTKISFRSKPGDTPDTPAIDVNRIAAKLGGGGHAFAAGARTAEDLATTRAAVLELLG